MIWAPIELSILSPTLLSSLYTLLCISSFSFSCPCRIPSLYPCHSMMHALFRARRHLIANTQYFELRLLRVSLSDVPSWVDKLVKEVGATRDNKVCVVFSESKVHIKSVQNSLALCMIVCPFSVRIELGFLLS